MKFLADENIGLQVINSLHRSGFDIKSVLHIRPGISDAQILTLANQEKRTLITADKDFGELVYSGKLAHSGVILLRLKKDSSQNKIKVLHQLIHKYSNKLHQAFTVVTETTVRIRVA